MLSSAAAAAAAAAAKEGITGMELGASIMVELDTAAGYAGGPEALGARGGAKTTHSLAPSLLAVLCVVVGQGRSDRKNA